MADRQKQRIYQLVLLLCIVIIIILLGLTIHYGMEASSASSPTQKDELDARSKESILKKFKGFFRTPREQAEFATRMGKRKPVKQEYCPSNANANTGGGTSLGLLTNVTSETRTRRSSPSTLYHGCCQSESYYTSPDTAMDDKGQNVTLVQYKQDRQHFQTESCCQDPNCSECTCKQGDYNINALVYNPVDGPDEPPVVVKTIIIPGCCRCENNSL